MDWMQPGSATWLLLITALCVLILVRVEGQLGEKRVELQDKRKPRN